MPVYEKQDDNYLASYRVKRLESQDELMNKLSGKKALFDGYPSLLIYSALIGYCAHRFDEKFDEKKQAESVQVTFFPQHKLHIIDLLAFARTGEPSVLYNRKKFDIFSAYAAGGFEILVEKLGVGADTDFQNQEILHELAKKLTSLILQGCSAFDEVSDLL